MTTKKKGPIAPAMKIARIYLRVSTDEQDLSRQAAIVDSTVSIRPAPPRFLS